jgi:uncharacterized protein YndB with AHSA1/START domain
MGGLCQLILINQKDNPDRMDRVKFEMEFIFRASPAILYTFITTPSCLVRWFCDEVDINDDVYTFSWQGAEENAEMIDDIEEERVKFQWEDADEGEFLEFRMYKSDVTNETILEITDYCDADEVEDQKQLWTSQIEKMRVETGG